MNLPVNPSTFRIMGGAGDVVHCERCHKVIRLYNAVTDHEALCLLEAHSAFNCVEDPYAAIVATR
jgi:hypothetical protein